MPINSKPSISVDCVVFHFDQETEQLSVLLVHRKSVVAGQPTLSLPGDEVMANELILDAANRVLLDQASLEIPLYRFRSFEDPARLNRPDPSESRVITKAFVGFTNNTELTFGSLAASGGFCPISEVPEKLLYDHRDILNAALNTLKRATANHLLPLEGMPELFTITEIQQLYETILEERLDKRNFRRAILSKGYLNDSGKMLTGQNFRPAKLFAFDRMKFQNLLDRELEKLPVVLF